MEVNNDELAALRSGKKLPQRSGEYWSEEERKDLQRRFMEGDDLSKLALHYKRGELAIIEQLIRAGLMKQQGRPRNRRSKKARGSQCLCKVCDVASCQNCGRGCAYAG